MSGGERAAAGEAAAAFAVEGEVRAVEPFEGGHINTSWVVTVERDGARRRYLLQRINTRVLRDPGALMENIARVTAHVRGVVERRRAADVRRRSLTLVAARDGGTWVSRAGSAWRMYEFIEGSRSRSEVSGAADARRAGAAFGEFQRMLADLPPPRLKEILPGFHDTPARLAALEAAAAADAAGRRRDVGAELEFARARGSRAGELAGMRREGVLPERVAHNDAKLSNVLLDGETGEALCVVDLDTVMPGLALFDFGDLVRSTTCGAAEDETRLERVTIEPALFEALAEGYLGAAGEMLCGAERAHLVTAGEIIALEQGVRFLTDHLNGDTYYAIARPGHNLDRARAQFALLESLERRRGELEHMVRMA